MTTEQKAAAYDKAIERTRRMIEDYKNRGLENYIACVKESLEKIFPELKESEDERIRKVLLELISTYLRGNENGKIHSVYAKDILAWLEKQGTSYTKKDVDDAYLEGVTNTKNEIEKQYEANYQIRKDIATFIFNYRGVIKDRAKWMNYLGIKVSFVEKQDEQEHVEWSEEDEDNLRKARFYVNYYQTHEADSKEAELCDNWLKSLKERVQPQNKWRPSDEQLEALDSATENCAYSEYQDCLRELIGQLKKLRDE